MTKADIINEVAIATGMAKKEVSIVVESFMEEVKKSLIQNKENVYLRGFGSFNIKHRAAKTARNISTKNCPVMNPSTDRSHYACQYNTHLYISTDVVLTSPKTITTVHEIHLHT